MKPVSYPFLLCICYLIPALLGAGASDPEEPVRNLRKAIMEAMEAGEDWNYETNFQHFREVVPATHHFPAIARHIFGDKWRDLEEEQRTRFIRKLAALGIARMAGNFGGAETPGNFESLSTRQLREDQFLIRSKLVRKGRDDIRFDFLVVQNDKGWGIVSVIVDGVNDLALKRSEYRSVVKREGFEALIGKMSGQITDHGGIPGAVSRPNPEPYEAPARKTEKE